MEPYQKQDFGLDAAYGQGGPGGMQYSQQPGMGMDYSQGMEPASAQGGLPPRPVMGPAARALAREEARLERMKGDTYKERRRLGRPKHSMGSTFAIIIGAGAWMLQGLAVITPMWRQSTLGVMGYAASRSWGIFLVKGVRTQTYHAQAYDTCGYFAELNVGGLCMSPICLWYKIKCKAYTDMMIYSYVIGSLMLIGLLIHLLCVIWSARFTCQTIRWAAGWWPFVAFLHSGCTAGWFVMSETMFDELNDHSMYPVPPVSGCFMASLVALCGTWCCAFIGCTQLRRWPDPTLDDFASTDDEEHDSQEDNSSDSSDTKKEKKKKKAAKAKQQGQGDAANVDNSLLNEQLLAAAAPAGGQPGYDMQGGYTMQQPGGYDMSSPSAGGDAFGIGPTQHGLPPPQENFGVAS